MRLTIRVDLDARGSVGPGKVRLLECVAEKGSIRAAAAKLRMSYKRAWMLIRDLDEIFGAPVVETETGGKAGGGAKLSRLGAALVAEYRNIERASHKASARSLGAISRLAAKRPR